MSELLNPTLEFDRKDWFLAHKHISIPWPSIDYGHHESITKSMTKKISTLWWAGSFAPLQFFLGWQYWSHAFCGMLVCTHEAYVSCHTKSRFITSIGWGLIKTTNIGWELIKTYISSVQIETLTQMWHEAHVSCHTKSSFITRIIFSRRLLINQDIFINIHWQTKNKLSASWFFWGRGGG